jgi:MFS transporter, PAT family, beta-lactamase induction signal transducer AmpG
MAATSAADRRQLSILRVFTQRKMAAILLLGFSSGLPLYLSSRTLQAWMTLEGVDLTTIGLFSLVALPYSLKFVWAPVMDRYIPPFLGRRRGWLLITQVALLLSIAAMSLHDPSRGLRLLAFNTLLIVFFSASQDIVFNAYQVDALDEREMGAGAAIGVLGYRIAMIVTGSLAFVLADRLPWHVVYLLMALLMAVGIAAAFWAPEPVMEEAPPKSMREAVVLPFMEFFQRTGFLWGLVILLFVILYQLPDRFGQNMVTPFLLQTGFSQTEIGAIQGGIGLLFTIIGVLAGGAVIAWMGINRSVWVFFFLQILSNLSYYWISQVGPDGGILVVATIIETFSGGLVTAVFVALLMSLSSKRFSATQFALLSSLMSAARDILVAPAGGIAESTGWPMFFLFTLAVGIPALLLLPFVTPWNAENPRGAAAHSGRVVKDGEVQGPAVEEGS